MELQPEKVFHRHRVPFTRDDRSWYWGFEIGNQRPEAAESIDVRFMAGKGTDARCPDCCAEIDDVWYSGITTYRRGEAGEYVYHLRCQVCWSSFVVDYKTDMKRRGFDGSDGVQEAKELVEDRCAAE